MKLSARLAFHACRNVLVTDLGWPAYHEVLNTEAQRLGRRVTMVAVRDDLFSRRIDQAEIVDRVIQRIAEARCDGLFLSAVSNLGLRLPAQTIVRTAEAMTQMRFVAIDGAQDFCHVGLDLRSDYCDLYIAGCHKWLGAYHPMGLGFYGRRRSRHFIDTVVADLIGSGELDDPLLRFSRELEADEPSGLGETVNLASLFACQGAVSDALRKETPPNSCLASRLANLEVAASIAHAAGWSPLLPVPSVRSGILLLQAENPRTRGLSPQSVRTAFAEAGVVLTAYDLGVVRLSMPDTPWRGTELEQLRQALAMAA